MATQAEIQELINEIQTNASYPATKMNPLLSAMLDFASAGQTQVFDGLVANDTTMEDTTLVLEYGVNIVITATPTDYACRLPIPTTGKRVTVVNNSLMQIFLFPDYNEGVAGRINNGAVGAPAIIPPDGKVYDFICVDNPLPGAWVWSPPATAQYDSGDITGTTTTSGSVILGIETGLSTVSESPTYGTGDVWYSPSISTPISTNGYAYQINSGFTALFKPIGVGNNWNAITKIKVYTNISSDVGAGELPKFSISGAWGINKYVLGSDPTVEANWLACYPGSAFTYLYADLDQVVSGTVPPPGLTANVGDDGTCYKIFTIGVDYIFPDPLSLGQTSIVGDKYIGVGTYTFGPTTVPCDDYMSLQLSGNLQAEQAAVGVKYRFFFEYN